MEITDFTYYISVIIYYLFRHIKLCIISYIIHIILYIIFYYCGRDDYIIIIIDTLIFMLYIIYIISYVDIVNYVAPLSTKYNNPKYNNIYPTSSMYRNIINYVAVI